MVIHFVKPSLGPGNGVAPHSQTQFDVLWW